MKSAAKLVPSKGGSFVDAVFELSKEKGITIMEAIMFLNDTEDIELEKLASLVRSSPKLKAALQEEAVILHMLKKPA